MWRWCVLLLTVLVLIVAQAHGKLDTEEEDTGESGDRDLVDDNSSNEHIGASVTQVTKYPFAASLHRNNTYICSAVILNTHWVITESKCFTLDIVSSYVSHRNLKLYSLRVGSTYNNKGGSLHELVTLINNFDLKVSAVKISVALEFNSRISPVRLPGCDEEVTLGYLASIIAWTPVGHMRLVNAPIIESSICEPITKLMSGYYICVGGVQDLNRHFCRKDNGGAVIQNDTLVAISSFTHPCAVYSRTHAFPKVSTFTRWLDSVIWEDDKRPTSSSPVPTTVSSPSVPNVTESAFKRTPYFNDPRKYMLTLPFAPVNVPLIPNGDNSVMPRMSLYESYLQSIARAKTTSTTIDPKELEEQKMRKMEMAWMKKYGAMMVMPAQYYSGKRIEGK